MNGKEHGNHVLGSKEKVRGFRYPIVRYFTWLMGNSDCYTGLGKYMVSRDLESQGKS